MIEDYLKVLFSQQDHSKFILGNITHPDDLPLDDSYLPKEVQKAKDDYHEGRRLGWIDIGLHKGNDHFQNLSQIYGAVKYARTNASRSTGKINSEYLIKNSIKKLQQHNVINYDYSKIDRMNKLFENHGIWKNPRALSYAKFTSFVVDFVREFMKICPGNEKRKDKK